MNRWRHIHDNPCNIRPGQQAAAQILSEGDKHFIGSIHAICEGNRTGPEGVVQYANRRPVSTSGNHSLKRTGDSRVGKGYQWSDIGIHRPVELEGHCQIRRHRHRIRDAREHVGDERENAGGVVDRDELHVRRIQSGEGAADGCNRTCQSTVQRELPEGVNIRRIRY